MTKKFSSFKEQQALVENFRRFVERERLEEEVDKAMKYHLQKILAEGQLTEGIPEKWDALKKKWMEKGKRALSVSAMISTLASGLVSTPAQAGFLEDAKDIFGNQIEQIQAQAQKTAEEMGIVFDQDGKAVKSTKKAKKTLEDFVKEQVKGVKTIKKSIRGGNGKWVGDCLRNKPGISSNCAHG